jgi:spore germination protein KA
MSTWRRRRRQPKGIEKENNKEKDESIESLFQQLNASNDFTHFTFQYEKCSLAIGYFSTLIDSEILHRDVFLHLEYCVVL